MPCGSDAGSTSAFSGPRHRASSGPPTTPGAWPPVTPTTQPSSEVHANSSTGSAHPSHSKFSRLRPTPRTKITSTCNQLTTPERSDSQIRGQIGGTYPPERLSNSRSDDSQIRKPNHLADISSSSRDLYFAATSEAWPRGSSSQLWSLATARLAPW